MIQLVGPGGSGKTTVGSALADRLGIEFVDLDEQFTASAGDISGYLSAHGYGTYATLNIQLYLDTFTSMPDEAVLALSSGFMTYCDDAHEAYRDLRRAITASPATFALLPSLDYEVCVRETVRRQLKRSFSRPAAREEQVIRARFPLHRDLPVRKIETSAPVNVVVDRIVADLQANIASMRSWAALG